MNTEQFEPFIAKQPVINSEVTKPIDSGQVLRYLGYPANRRPAGGAAQVIEKWIHEASKRATPRAAYVVLPVASKDKNRLVVSSASGETEFQGAIDRYLGVSQLILSFIATAGPEVEHLASQLMAEGEELPAMIVSAVGAERAEAAELAVIDRVRQQVFAIGFAPTFPYAPGYCGMALTQQKQLFSLFSGQTVGVRLTDSCLMKPIKSLSGLVGLAPKEEIVTQGSSCDRCDLKSCYMRR